MANTLDLTHFQYDFDQSFVVFLMHPDMTIYARYGTRSERPETEDISLEGLRAAMTEALRLFPNHEAVKPLLAGKQVRPGRFRVPTDYPVLTRYKDRLDYEGAVVQSCLHCHQIRDAERTWYRSRNERMPDEVVFPYPDPEVLGLRLDPKGMTRVAGVEPGSTGERAGFKKGDEIKTLAGQPLYSTADLQWVLQHAPDRGQLEAEVVRGGESRPVTVTLEEGWRRRGNISWRVSTWNLRRMGFGGMVLEDLSDEQRRAAQLPAEAMAFRVKHVGQFGDHAVAKKAGFLVGDIIRSFDGLNRRMSESQLLAYTMQEKRAGDSVILKVERGGKEETLKLTLPPAGTNPG